MIQNEARMYLRVLMLSDVSGGGCFLVVLVAATGLDCDGGLELTAGIFASVLILSPFSMLVDGRRGNCGWHKSPQPRVVSCRIELALRRIVIGWSSKRNAGRVEAQSPLAFSGSSSRARNRGLECNCCRVLWLLPTRSSHSRPHPHPCLSAALAPLLCAAALGLYADC